MLILYASFVPVLRSMGTALLAGASIASVVIGLAAQSTLGNLVAGVSITIYRPFKLNDTLQVATPVGAEVGVVELITLGYTRLRTADGRRVVMPNSLAASQVTLNLTEQQHAVAPAESAASIEPIELRVPRAADLDALRQAAFGAATAVAGVAASIACDVVRIEADDAVLALRCELATATAATGLRSRLLVALAARFASLEPRTTFS